MNAKLPGITCAVIVAIAALFLSEHYGASAMLFALLLGMAMNFLGQEGKCVAGIHFAASTILRIGVALLGLRITFHEIAALGLNTGAMIIAAVVLTLLFGAIFVRFTSADTRFGILTGGAVAICGASAALAIAAVLPRGANHDRDTSFTVIGVTALSTIAMIIYPIASRALGFDEHQAGIFIGGTIHDVAQVVGAGYSVGKEAGDTATIVKLLRVAMLLPVILVLSLVMHRNSDKASRPPLLPWFAVAFGLLVAVNSLIDLPKPVTQAAGELSRFALVVAIAAIGMKTSLKELTVLGLKPVLLMVAETLFLAGIIIGMMKLLNL
ncbi:MAG: putative sulfate exporter family transporter [Betaproteobacteria bacterium]|nr:putative sulfate exporter family transporter [Betaproteobacteria bacterium]